MTFSSTLVTILNDHNGPIPIANAAADLLFD